MKRKTLVVLSAAALAATVLAGCGNKKASETTAPTTAVTEAVTEAPKPVEEKMDLVVAGGDGAGLLAAIQAVKEGADPSKIVILEKSGEVGSDIASMEDFVNAVNTDEQYDQEIDDSFETFLADIKKAGNEKNNQDLAEFMAESGELALTWLRDAGIEMEGVVKKEGSSMARSFTAAGDAKLTELLSDHLLKEAEKLKIQIRKNTEIKEVMFSQEDGRVTGVKVAGKDGDETIHCIALLTTDTELLPLLKTAPVTFTTNAEGKETGVLVNNCAEVVGTSGESVPGLYAAGSMIDAAVYGEKALPGNQMTGMILFGMTAGTETEIYISDNQ
ncbi:MAG: FAD-binding protein [Clostridium sp.]